MISYTRFSSNFHDVVIHAIGYTINFEFDRLNGMDFRNYTIIAYNDHGKSTSFDFEIISASVGTFLFVMTEILLYN
jgi:hypothetical protein